MALRINNKKRLYRQYIRTRDIERYPTRIFNFKRTKWRFFQKILGTTAKYKFKRFAKHQNRYFIKKRFNFVKSVKLPKLTDSFIKTPRAAKWSSRKKAFLMRWMRDKSIRYDYGNLVPRNKPLKSDEKEEILTKRFFAMYFRLGYLLIHNKYFLTFPELSKNLQNNLITVKNGSANIIAEMSKGAIVEVKSNKFIMNLIYKPFLYNFKYRYIYDRLFRNRYDSNFIKLDTFFRKKHLVNNIFYNNKINVVKKNKKSSKKIKKNKKLPEAKIIFQHQKKSHLKSQRNIGRKTWQKSYKALLSHYALNVFKRAKKKSQRKLVRRLKLKKRIPLRVRSRLGRILFRLPYAIKKKFIKKKKSISKIISKPVKKKSTKLKKVKFIRKILFMQKKSNKQSTIKKIETLIKQVRKKNLQKKLLFKKFFRQKFFRRKSKNKVIKRRVFLPFIEHDRYTQTLTIIKDQNDLSRNDCVLLNPRKNTLTRSSFLRNRQ